MDYGIVESDSLIHYTQHDEATDHLVLAGSWLEESRSSLYEVLGEARRPLYPFLVLHDCIENVYLRQVTIVHHQRNYFDKHLRYLWHYPYVIKGWVYYHG